MGDAIMSMVEEFLLIGVLATLAPLVTAKREPERLPIIKAEAVPAKTEAITMARSENFIVKGPSFGFMTSERDSKKEMSCPL